MKPPLSSGSLEFECIYTSEGHGNELKSVSWNIFGSLLTTCGREESVRV